MSGINEKGYSLAEILIAMTISAIVMAAVVVAYVGSVRAFRDVKSISDNIDTKTPSIELVSRYFDRWGVGVPDNTTSTTCSTTAYPDVRSKCMSYNSGTPCDNISFFGNFYGMGFVHDVSGNLAGLISCRLSTGSNQNCYNLWRNNQVRNTVTLSLDNLSTSTGNCLSYNDTANTSGTSDTHVTNATVNCRPKDTSGNLITDNDSLLRAGDIIQRSPHWITLYCANNPSADKGRWLYAKMKEIPSVSGSCNANANAVAIAPVAGFAATPLPSGCNFASGGCSAVSVTVTFRSLSKKSGNQSDNYTITRIFGR